MPCYCTVSVCSCVTLSTSVAFTPNVFASFDNTSETTDDIVAVVTTHVFCKNAR